ncbi:MAG: hypothetical protein GY730_11160 [bacterium]|nr:hypothetical protein [bacterium]
MINQETTVLLSLAVSTGFLHTVTGPDHYLPFIVMSKAGKWSKSKTAWITLLSGSGHLLSSIIAGTAGIIFGVAVSKLKIIDSVRGEFAAWALIIFGLVYLLWGIRAAIKNNRCSHLQNHNDGTAHNHKHLYSGSHTTVPENKDSRKDITPWILFSIFVLGPCEPLIPVLMYPAAKGSFINVMIVTSAFAVTTLATMFFMVMTFLYGKKIIKFNKIEKYGHIMAGSTIFLTGSVIKLTGL